MNLIVCVMIYNLLLTCVIDFAHIATFFLSSNDNSLKTHDSMQQKNFNKLLIECNTKQDAEKIILNFSKVEKSILLKGLSFSLPPKKLSYSISMLLRLFS